MGRRERGIAPGCIAEPITAPGTCLWQKSVPLRNTSASVHLGSRNRQSRNNRHPEREQHTKRKNLHSNSLIHQKYCIESHLIFYGVKSSGPPYRGIIAVIKGTTFAGPSQHPPLPRIQTLRWAPAGSDPESTSRRIGATYASRHQGRTWPRIRSPPPVICAQSSTELFADLLPSCD